MNTTHWIKKQHNGKVDEQVNKIANALLVPLPSLPKRAMPAFQKEVEETPNNEGKTAEVIKLLLSGLAPLGTSVDYNAAALAVGQSKECMVAD